MLTLTNPRQHSAELLREAAEPIGLAIPADPMAGLVKPQQWYPASVGRRSTALIAGGAS